MVSLQQHTRHLLDCGHLTHLQTMPCACLQTCTTTADYMFSGQCLDIAVLRPLATKPWRDAPCCRGSTSEGSEDYGSSDGSSGSTSSSGYYSSDMDGDDLDTEEVECFSK
jgi:hypothetical protein